MQKSYENANICCICLEKFEDKDAKDKKYHKVRDHGECGGAAKGTRECGGAAKGTRECGGAANSICNLKYIAPKEIPIVS